MKRRAACVFLLLTILTLPAAAQQPKLVVYISIDQMKAEYFEWYKSEFSGGFKLLLQEGVDFTNADLHYAPSETGPGHAALGAGCYPFHSGIVSNEWLDPHTGKRVYCVQDKDAGKVDGEGGGFSPKNLLVSALGDWIKHSSPGSKVTAVSVKDRAAILMGGQHPDHVFWYDKGSGHMVTSDYYEKQMPGWVRNFNAADWVEHNVPSAWTKLKPQSVYEKYGPDEMEGEQKWQGSSSFPHAFQQEKRREQFLTSPYGDLMTLDFAREAVYAEKLGQRGETDLLLISLSCADYIGHAYGGNSHEIVDYLIRMDQALGKFIDEIEKTVGAGNLLIALSADHGAMPLPEYRKVVQANFARRILVQKEIYPRIDSLDRSLQKELSTKDHVIVSRSFLNYGAALRAGVDSLNLERKVKEGMMRIDGIADVFFRRDLAQGVSPTRPYQDYLQRGYYPSRSKDFYFLPCEFCLFTSSATGTSHGTPYWFDTHVPILIWGSGLKGKEITRRVYSVDIAPTIAKYLGVAFPSSVDGVPLKEIMP